MNETSPSNFQLKSPSFRLQGSLRRNVILGLLLVAFIPLTLLGSITFFRSKNLLSDLTKSQMRVLVDNNISQITDLYQINQKLSQQIQSDSAVSKSFALLLEDPQHQTRRFTADLFLTSYQTKYGRSQQPLFDQIAFLDSNGKYIIGTNDAWTEENFAANNDPIFNYLGKTKTGIFLNPTSLYKNQLVLLSTWPLYDEDHQILGTFFAFSISDLFRNQIKNTTSFFPEAQVFFVTQNEQLVSIDENTNQFIPINLESTNSSEILENFQTKKSTSFISSPNADTPFSGYFGTFEEIDAGFVLQVPQNFLVQQIDILGSLNLVILVVSLITLVAVGYFASSSIVNPLVALVNQARDFSNGNWSTRVNVHRSDEIGLLASTFNEMGDRITSLYNSLEKRVEEQSERYKITSEITRLVSGSKNRSELLQRTLDLLISHFEFSYCCMFFYDDPHKLMVLTYQSGDQPGNQLPIGYRLPLAAISEINWAFNQNKARRILRNSDQPSDILNIFPDSTTSACIPFSFDKQNQGVLNIHAAEVSFLDNEMMIILEDILSHVSNGWKKIKSTETGLFEIDENSPMTQASLKLTGCQTKDEAFRIILRSLQEAGFVAGFFSIEEENARLVGVVEPDSLNIDTDINISFPVCNIPNQLLRGQYTILKDLYFNNDADLTVISLVRNRNCQSGAVIPLNIDFSLSAILIIGSREIEAISNEAIDSMENILSVLRSTISRIERSDRAEKQAEQLRIAAEIARDIAGSLTIDEILKKSVNLVRDRFGYYHASIFMIDSIGEYAVLQESSGTIGEQLKNSKHRLAIGSNSLIGKSTQKQLPVISNDVKSESSYFPNPFLPETQSELVIPLISGNQLLGALDVH